MFLCPMLSSLNLLWRDMPCLHEEWSFLFFLIKRKRKRNDYNVIVICKLSYTNRIKEDFQHHEILLSNRLSYHILKSYQEPAFFQSNYWCIHVIVHSFPFWQLSWARSSLLPFIIHRGSPKRILYSKDKNNNKKIYKYIYIYIYHFLFRMLGNPIIRWDSLVWSCFSDLLESLFKLETTGEPSHDFSDHSENCLIPRPIHRGIVFPFLLYQFKSLEMMVWNHPLPSHACSSFNAEWKFQFWRWPYLLLLAQGSVRVPRKEGWNESLTSLGGTKTYETLEEDGQGMGTRRRPLLCLSPSQGILGSAFLYKTLSLVRGETE